MDATRWDASDLATRLRRSVVFAKEAMRRFAAAGFTDEESPADSRSPETICVETAMLLYVAARVAHEPSTHAMVGEIAELLVPRVRSEQTLLRIALHPSRALSIAVAHVLLAKLGHPDEDFDAMLARSGSALAAAGRERAPVERMEEAWIASLLPFAPAGSGMESALRESVVGRSLDLLGGAREDGYAFGHVLMYATDFGARATTLPRPAGEVMADASARLAVALDGADCDLAGELLCTWPLTRTAWSAGAAFAWKLLAAIEDRIGFLPSETTRESRIQALQGVARSDYLLGTTYHTAYVMGLISALALLPGRAPPGRVPEGSRCSPRFADAMWEIVQSEIRLWQPDLSVFEPDERRNAAPFLLDLALAQACRNHDFELARLLLAEASSEQVAVSPLCAQTSQLLDRVAHLPLPRPGDVDAAARPVASGG